MHNYFKWVGCEFATTQLIDACTQELRSRDEHGSLTCKQLIGWKRATATGRSQDDDVAAS